MGAVRYEDEKSGAQQAHGRLQLARADYPVVRLVAADVSAGGQRWYMRAILLELAASLLAAVASDLSSLFAPAAQAPLAWLAGILLLVAIGTQVLRRWGQFDQRWFQGRAVAESAKTASWRYMMGVPPYDDPDRADEEFAGLLKVLLERSPLIRRGVPRDDQGPPAATERMRAVRSAPWQRRCELYVAERLDDQIGWYGGKAAESAAWSRYLGWATVAAQVLAIVSAGLRIADPSLNLVGVFTTLAASFIAWGQARRFEELASSYGLAHAELQQIKQRIASTPTEEGFLPGVVDGEGAISREHTMWVAKSGSSVLWPLGTHPQGGQ